MNGQEDRAGGALPVSRASRTTGRPRSADVDPTILAQVVARLTDFGELRLKSMDGAGIERAVLSIAGPGVQAEPDAATAVRVARAGNDFLAREVQKRPDRYSGFGHLPMQDAESRRRRTRTLHDGAEVRRRMINGHTNGQYLDHPSLAPFWERADALGAIIYIHPDRSGDALARARRPQGLAPRHLGMDVRDRLARAAAGVRRRVRPLSARAHRARPHGRDAAVSCCGASTAAPSSTASSSPRRRRTTSRRTSW